MIWKDIFFALDRDISFFEESTGLIDIGPLEFKEQIMNKRPGIGRRGASTCHPVMCSCAKGIRLCKTLMDRHPMDQKCNWRQNSLARDTY